MLFSLFLTDSQSPLALLLNVVNNLSGLQHCQAYQAWGLSKQLKIIHNWFLVHCNLSQVLLCLTINIAGHTRCCYSLYLLSDIGFNLAYMVDQRLKNKKIGNALPPPPSDWLIIFFITSAVCHCPHSSF